MFKHFSRTIKPLAVTVTLLTCSWSVFATSPWQEPTAGNAKRTEEKEVKEVKATPAEATGQKAADQKATDKKATASTGTPRVLSEKEDPRLIGKRSINGGGIFTGGGSIEKEVSLGRQLAADVDRQAKFIDDPIITEYVNRVGQNVVLHSDAKIPFTIKVIDSDEANAFALPGGFFYVNKGLLLAADNEAELAGVMAHEIAHVTARHAMENMRKGQWMEGLATVGSIFLGGIPGMIYQSTAGLGLTAIFLRFNRGAEEEADNLGAQYLYAAGYDPGAMSTMFEKLLAKNKKKPGLIAKVFSTHPQTAERMEASRALVARFPERDEYVLSTSEFQRVKNRLLRLSNARATTAGDLAGDSSDTTPGRPTLKRRQPAPDETTGTTPAGQKAPEPGNEPPKLKRRDAAEPSASPQPTTPPQENR